MTGRPSIKADEMLEGKASVSFVIPCVLGFQRLSIFRNMSLLLLFHAN